MLDSFVKALKRRLRKPYHEMRKRYLLRFHGFDSAQLMALLRHCGVQAGDAICVHSGMGGFSGFHGSVTDVIRAFQSVIGAQGTLLMPAFSFGGSALDYARSEAIFDPRRTPSQTGLISEIFRRSPGVERSLHPTHSLCAWGRHASEWIGTHLEADTPCGCRSPFEHFAAQNVKIIFAGASPSTLTYFHFVEELLEPQMPFSPFTGDRFSLRYRKEGAVVLSPPMRLYDPAVSRRRTLVPLFQELQRNGKWRTGRVGTLEIVVLLAADVLESARHLAAHGTYCYRP